MTPTSQATRSPGRRRGVPSRPRPVLRIWHAACLLVGSTACIYPFPLRTREANAAPELKNMWPAANTGEPVEIVGHDQTFFVVAKDPELDDVHFDWSLTRDGPVNDRATESLGDDNSEVSQITFSPDPDLDGQSLRCAYWDEGNGATQPVLEWILSVPSGEEP